MEAPQYAKTPDFARSSTYATGPENKVRREFPIELGRVDYLRKLYFNIGAALLCVHQHVLARLQEGKRFPTDRAEINDVDSNNEETDLQDVGSDEDLDHNGMQESSPVAHEAIQGLKLSALENILNKLCQNPEDDLRVFQQSHGMTFDADAKSNRSPRVKKSKKKKKLAQKMRGLQKKVETYTYRLAAWSAALHQVYLQRGIL